MDEDYGINSAQNRDYKKAIVNIEAGGLVDCWLDTLWTSLQGSKPIIFICTILICFITTFAQQLPSRFHL